MFFKLIFRSLSYIIGSVTLKLSGFVYLFVKIYPKRRYSLVNRRRREFMSELCKIVFSHQLSFDSKVEINEEATCNCILVNVFFLHQDRWYKTKDCGKMNISFWWNWMTAVVLNTHFLENLVCFSVLVISELGWILVITWMPTYLLVGLSDLSYIFQ